MKPEQFLDILWRERGTAIMRTGDQTVAAEAMEAAVRGGFRVCEFTMTTPGVLELIAQFAGKEGIVVGAGTVLTVADARAAAGAGARFLVSPVVDEEVIAAAAELGVAMMPGTHTPTEMLRAHRAGAQLQKLFPAAGGGPDYVRSILGPLPMLRIVPTNGVDESNAAAYLQAGAFATGFVRALFPPAAMATGDMDAVEERAQDLKAALDSVDRPAQRP
jgi:2-dehydro-3-deoxyphosphogluconate aldolase / (4S)-4-hydroxy-2-oxoglutarate aldolase